VFAVRGFPTKHVADVQKLAEVGDLFIVIRSCSALYCALKHLRVRKNGGDQMFEIIRVGVAFYHDQGGSLLSYQDPLHSERG
jgi:hypothetical protein